MGFSNERMRTGQLVNWFLLDGLELTPAGYPVTQALSLPFGVDHLIACEQLSRKCYTMEYDPRYVDVIVQRWEDFTGEKAVRLK